MMEEERGRERTKEGRIKQKSGKGGGQRKRDDKRG